MTLDSIAGLPLSEVWNPDSESKNRATTASTRGDRLFAGWVEPPVAKANLWQRFYFVNLDFTPALIIQWKETKGEKCGNVRGSCPISALCDQRSEGLKKRRKKTILDHRFDQKVERSIYSSLQTTAVIAKMLLKKIIIYPRPLPKFFKKCW